MEDTLPVLVLCRREICAVPFRSNGGKRTVSLFRARRTIRFMVCLPDAKLYS